MYNEDPRYSFNSDGDTTHGSMNFHNESTQQINRLDDGTLEITDTLPKKEYYMSLRRNDNRLTGSCGRLGSTAGFGTMSAGTIRPGFFGKRSQSIIDFKPSGKNMECLVIMLDGSEEIFTLDRQCYGQHLFDMVCDHLELQEREYFGITFKDTLKIWYWLDFSKRLLKQTKEDRLIFEFQVKFYPPTFDIVAEDLTRYYFCLQVRQDLVSGTLPCSFYVYIILGSYSIQSEAGDYDLQSHRGIDYIRDQPFAPQQFQTEEMLNRIMEMHKSHRGQTPEEADRNFLDNAKKLALYGVDRHKAKNSSGEEEMIGVYHGGLLVYRQRIRVIRFSWARLIKVSYKQKKILLNIRDMSKNDQRKELVYKCKDVKMAKRLYQAIVDHHYFFRMIEFGIPKKPNLKPGFATRKYVKNPASASPGQSRRPEYSSNSIDRNTSNISSVAPSGPKFRRLPQNRKEQTDDSWFTLPTKNESFSKQNMVTSSPRAHAEMSSPLHRNAPQNNFNSQENSSKKIESIENRKYGARPQIPPLYWRMSPADCTISLGMDEKGLDVASQPGEGWQGCRANKGVKAAGEYFYEARVLEPGLVRLGWSTNDASLNLGSDKLGYGYGADNDGNGWGGKSGRCVHNNEAIEYGLGVNVGDYVGCRINMDDGEMSYYLNGQPLNDIPYKIADHDRREPFFPTLSVKDGRTELNFGESAAFVFPPSDSDNWIPVCRAEDTNQAPNQRIGWKMNAYDAGKGMDVAPEGLMVQSQLNSGWQGVRCNKGVKGRGKYYYEVRPLEDGLGRVGWSTEAGSLDLGSDKQGFGYGSDPDGFGLSGNQGKKMYKNDIENYGKAFKCDDTIGCMLDLDEGVVQWSLNGEIFQKAYEIPLELRNGPLAFFPHASMKDNTMEFNFGEKVFKHYPGSEWTPLTYTLEPFQKASRRKGPERKVKGWSYLNQEDMDKMHKPEEVKPINVSKVSEPIRLNVISDDEPSESVSYPSNVINKTGTRTVTNGEVTEVQTGEPNVETEQYIDEHGNLVTRTVTKTKKITKTTKTMSELVTERSENDVATKTTGKFTRLSRGDDDCDDEILRNAILAVTFMDGNAAVLNDYVGSLEFSTSNKKVDQHNGVVLESEI